MDNSLKNTILRETVESYKECVMAYERVVRSYEQLIDLFKAHIEVSKQLESTQQKIIERYAARDEH